MKRQMWPTAREYAKAVGDPYALGDFELRTGTLESLPGGRPKAYGGTFTATFRFEIVSGGAALRCYTRGNDDLERRYTAIADLLRYVRHGTLCQTQYVADCVRVGETWWPAVKMEWSAGRPLNAAIEAQLQDGDAMLALAKSFREVVRSLGVLGVAHGDLQHGNILVSQGNIRLIDYDAMYLPTIADLPQTEYGHRNYQHPRRRTAPFDARLDRFPSIVIYTALVALAADRTLWRRFNDGENVLFRAHDFTSNGQSELFRSLLANNATSGLAEVLLAACRTSADRVPTLEEAIAAASGTMPVPSVVPPRRPAPVVHDVAPPLAAATVAADAAAASAPDSEAAVPAGAHASTSAFTTPSDDGSERPVDGPPHVTRRPAFLEGLVRSLVLGAIVAALAGLALGFGIAAFQRRATAAPAGNADRTVAAVATPSPRIAPPVRRTAKPVAIAQIPAIAQPAATVRPTPTAAAAATAAPTVKPTATPMPSPSPAPTTKPTLAPTPSPTAVPTVAPSPLKRGYYAALQGTWQIDEANVQDGRMVWAGGAVVSSGGTIVLDAHKESIAGQAATRCERQTALHASFALGVARQAVPFQEVNCQGGTSSGTIQVTSFSPGARSFSGTFWSGGVKLGDFQASKR